MREQSTPDRRDVLKALGTTGTAALAASGVYDDGGIVKGSNQVRNTVVESPEFVELQSTLTEEDVDLRQEARSVRELDRGIDTSVSLESRTRGSARSTDATAFVHGDGSVTATATLQHGDRPAKYYWAERGADGSTQVRHIQFTKSRHMPVTVPNQNGQRGPMRGPARNRVTLDDNQDDVYAPKYMYKRIGDVKISDLCDNFIKNAGCLAFMWSTVWTGVTVPIAFIGCGLIYGTGCQAINWIAKGLSTPFGDVGGVCDEEDEPRVVLYEVHDDYEDEVPSDYIVRPTCDKPTKYFNGGRFEFNDVVHLNGPFAPRKSYDISSERISALGKDASGKVIAGRKEGKYDKSNYWWRVVFFDGKPTIGWVLDENLEYGRGKLKSGEAKFDVGQEIVTISCDTNVQEYAGYDHKTLASVPAGTKGWISNGFVTDNLETWWEVHLDSVSEVGWVAGSKMKTPGTDAEGGCITRGDGSDDDEPEKEKPAFRWGSEVRIDRATGNVRSFPVVASDNIMHTYPEGEVGWVKKRPPGTTPGTRPEGEVYVRNQDLIWWYVDFGEYKGWISQPELALNDPDTSSIL